MSTYGEVEGTTPHVDALAAEGLVYERAFAPSPWTLPSHASLLTSLAVEEHGVGMTGRVTLPQGMVTVAQRLGAAGYQTAAFTENLLVSDVTDLLRGFDHRRTGRLARIQRGEKLSTQAIIRIDVVSEVEAWLASRDPSRPFFVFLNLNDAHSDYEIRDENPWVPRDVPRAEIERRSPRPEWLLCSLLPSPVELSVLRGLYLGDVAAADAKVGEAYRLLREAARGELITVVTADHGEQLGERGLTGHEFSVAAAVLDVPLVVHGRAGAAPMRIEEPVTLADVGRSILHWAGVDAAAPVDGPRLPEASAGESGWRERELVAAYSDRYVIDLDAWRGSIEQDDKVAMRKGCAPTDPVWGEKVSLIRYPYKLHWHPEHPPELYDLSWDPLEHSDLADQRRDLVGALTERIESIIAESGIFSVAAEPSAPPDDEVIRALEALGYLAPGEPEPDSEPLESPAR